MSTLLDGGPKAIRADVVTRLIAAETVAGDRVYNSRELPEETKDHPAISVRSSGGREKKWPQSGLVFHRTERLQIVGAVSGATTDEQLAIDVDDLETEIRDALFGDGKWVGTFKHVEEADCEKFLSIEGRVRIGAIKITLEVSYTTTYPATLEDDLNKVAATTQSTDPAGADVSERIFPIEVAP